VLGKKGTRQKGESLSRFFCLRSQHCNFYLVGGEVLETPHSGLGGNNGGCIAFFFVVLASSRRVFGCRPLSRYTTLALAEYLHCRGKLIRLNQLV
jgi:hypothetical protein